MTTWAYDNAGRVVSRTLPLGQVEAFNYDAHGNLTQKTDFNGQSTHYQYDSLSRETLKTLANGDTIATTYTSDGQVANVTDQHGTTGYTYDVRGTFKHHHIP